MADMSSATDAEHAPEYGANQQPRRVPAELSANIQALAGGWMGYHQAVDEVRSDCSGYTRGRSSCGASKVVSNRNTAFCRDAINRARTHLPKLEDLHSKLWSEARRAGTSPGLVRTQLRDRGLADFRTQINQARSNLDSWYGNLVE